jgi:hypothetical protein
MGAINFGLPEHTAEQGSNTVTGTIPPLPQDPPAVVVMAENLQELANGVSEQYRINEEISRQTGQTPPQGTNQR